MPRLTDLELKSLPIPAKGRVTVWDGHLGVRVTSKGAKTFITILQSGRRHTIGRYGQISLSQAREAAARLKAEKVLGHVLPSAITLEKSRAEYLDQITVRPATKDYYVRNLNTLKAYKLSEITPRDINKILDGFTPARKAQALRSFTAFFNWCLRRHYLDKSPCERMTLSPQPSRSRVLSDKEIATIWRCTEEPKVFNSIVRLALLTGQRVGEISKIEKSWIDLQNNICTLPSQICKNSREHRFPIGPLTASLLKSLLDVSPSGLLFPARAATPKPFNGWSKSSAALWKATNIQGATLHDARRTYATRMAALGCPIHILETALLNHVSGQISGVAAIYNRHNYIEEARIWVEKYDSWLTDVLRLSGTQIAAQ